MSTYILLPRHCKIRRMPCAKSKNIYIKPASPQQVCKKYITKIKIKRVAGGMGRFRILKQLICIIFLSLAPSCKIIVIHCVTALEVIRQLALQFFFFFFLLAFAIGLSVITSIQCCRCQRSNARTQVLHWQDST